MVFLKKISKFILFFFLAWVPASLLSDDDINISKLRVSSLQSGVRIIIDADKSPVYEVFSLQKPNRLVIDLAKVKFTEDFSFPSTSGLIQGVRFGSFNGDVSRIVFDLKSPVKKIKTKIRKPSSGSRRTLNIDIESHKKIKTLNKKNNKVEKQTIKKSKSFRKRGC